MEQLIQTVFGIEEHPQLDRITVERHLQQLPDHVQPLDSQVAGHVNGMFRDIRNGQLLKPILDKRGKRELRFYQLLFNESSQENQQTTKADHELIQRLRSFVPFFYGNEWLQQVQFIRLQDITQSMHQPNLMDIKIGRTTHDRLADEKKVQHELDKTTTNRTLGYRVLGVKIFDVESGRYLGKDRDHYKQLSVEQSNQTIDWFVSQIPTEKGAVIDAFVSKMKQLENWFDQDNLNRFEFISSSLLFAFSKSNSNQMQVDLRMIDFAHVFPLAGSKCLFEGMANQDHNYLFGLRNLIKLFIQIRAQL